MIQCRWGDHGQEWDSGWDRCTMYIGPKTLRLKGFIEERMDKNHGIIDDQ